MFRKAEVKDAHDIYLLMNDLEETVFDETEITDIFLKQCHDAERCILVYEKNNRILGVCNLLFRETLHNAGKICEIEEFIIHEAARNAGIGHQIIQRAFQAAREKNCVKVILSTSTRRIRAHHFYEREGMKMTHFMYEVDL